MNRETVKREWFGAVRSAADSSGKKLREESALTPVQAVKLDILLRQYLCDGLADHISESEKVSAEEADSLQKDIYSELIEDAIAGVWSETENMETAMFLFECTKGVRMESWFSALLKKILSEAGSEEAAQALMIGLYIAMDSFGTACNVTGDGAIALVIDKLTKLKS